MAQLSLSGWANRDSAIRAARRLCEYAVRRRDLQLPHMISGSGARYSDGKTTLWNKGDTVFVEVNDKIVVRDCMLEREGARLGLRGQKVKVPSLTWERRRSYRAELHRALLLPLPCPPAIAQE